MQETRPYSILFVCTGNICRSPTAEAVARRWLKQNRQEQNFLVDSAGISGYHVGQAPDRRARQAALTHGYPMDGLHARQVEAADFQRFDLLLGMDREHVAAMQHRAPPVYHGKITLFLAFASLPPDEQEIGDPYYGGAQGFEDVIALCERGVEALFAHLLASKSEHLAQG